MSPFQKKRDLPINNHDEYIHVSTVELKCPPGIEQDENKFECVAEVDKDHNECDLL